jgi:hypothetical protein
MPQSQASKEAKARYRERNRDTIKVKSLQYYYRSKDTENHKNRVLRRRYGITLADYNKFLEEQQGLCAICHKPETITKPGEEKPFALAVDHDHKTGKVRGLLCFRCNQFLGLVEKDLSLVYDIAMYITKAQNG